MTGYIVEARRGRLVTPCGHHACDACRAGLSECGCVLEALRDAHEAVGAGASSARVTRGATVIAYVAGYGHAFASVVAAWRGEEP